MYSVCVVLIHELDTHDYAAMNRFPQLLSSTVLTGHLLQIFHECSGSFSHCQTARKIISTEKYLL